MSSANPLQKELEKQLRSLPYRRLEKLIQEKLRAYGSHVVIEDVQKAIATAIENGNETLTLKTDPDIEISMELSSEDLNVISDDLDNFLRDDLPSMIIKLSKRGARTLTRQLRKDWPKFRAGEDEDVRNFKQGLGARWGKGIQHLEIIVAATNDLANIKFKKRRGGGRGAASRFGALARLHARASQVMGEIIVLLENGYADGAIARWRTLHEIAVISIIIYEDKTDLWRRFMQHEAIDSFNFLSECARRQRMTGINASQESELVQAEKRHGELLRLYGVDFGKPYGWAAYHLQEKRVTFADLEALASRSSNHWIYKFASLNIHMSALTFTESLALPPGSRSVLLGRSVYGLEVPAIHAVNDYVIVTSTIFSKKWVFDDLVLLQAMILLRDQAARLFQSAAIVTRRSTHAQAEPLTPTRSSPAASRSRRRPPG